MPDRRSKDWIYNYFENWFIPMAFGVIVVVVVIQFIGMVPGVRAVMDRVEGRFQEAKAVNSTPPGLVDASAVLKLIVSGGSASSVEVLKNHHSLGTFTTRQMRVTVHAGDVIQFIDIGGKKAEITVNTDSSDLFQPAPGQVVVLSPSSRKGSLRPVVFL